MSDQSDLKDGDLKEKIKIILNDDIKIKRWNEDLFLKLIILLPTIIFILGLFLINRPQNITQIIFLLLYPLTLISIGVIILFFMRSNLK